MKLFVLICLGCGLLACSSGDDYSRLPVYVDEQALNPNPSASSEPLPWGWWVNQQQEPPVSPVTPGPSDMPSAGGHHTSIAPPPPGPK